MIDPVFGYIDDAAYRKAAAYCAYQERSQQEVREKLYTLKVQRDDIENIIAKLVQDNFINEERFAIAYAGGKFRTKQWGKVKIKMMLQQKQVSAFCITKALNEINKDDYLQTLQQLIIAAETKIDEKNPQVKKHLISQKLISKGFESELVWDALR
jgi:regulatory protein